MISSSLRKRLTALAFLGASSIVLMGPWRKMTAAFAGQVAKQPEPQNASKAQEPSSKEEKKPAPESKPPAAPQAPPAEGGSTGVPPVAAPPSAAGQPAPAGGGPVTFRLENADLLQFINLVATQLGMNYVVDPAIKGTVTITTAGALRREDLFPILQAVLRINGATAIQTGNFYRIVPLGLAAKTPMEVSSDATGKTIPPDDRMVVQIIPLRFVFAGDMSKMLTPFLSDGGAVAVHETGNVLILEDSTLNLKRLLEIIEQFDSLTFARQRIRLVPVQNNVASGLVPELESIFSAYAMADKKTPLRFIALDRINSILVVTPEPSAFEEVEKWVEKLDQPAPPTGVQTFIYRVQNSEASYLQKLLTIFQRTKASSSGAEGAAAATAAREAGAAPGAEPESGQTTIEAARITTDPVNNSLIIQSTPQQYAEIVKTLKQLDVIPRQVMIEARVYEVDLTGALSFGVSYFLQERSSAVKQALGSFAPTTGLTASAGALVGSTRELMAFLNASENRTRVRVLSAPTVLATDNSDARINVGTTVPILTSQGLIPGVQAGSTSVFTNTVQNVETGIIMTVKPRITSTGLVTLSITQEVSAPLPPAAGAAIQSPSFSKRSINTNAVVGDGETIALGGLISDNITTTRNRIPLLGDIPGLGALFGSTSYSRSKTELIVLLTPHIVKSVAEARDATRDLRDSLSELKRSFKKEKVLNP